MRTTMLLPLLLLACDPFGDLPHGGYGTIEDSLWDPAVVSIDDGTYVRLPHARKLVRVQDNGKYQVVDLKGASPQEILADPAKERLLVFAEWPICDNPDKSIQIEDDCDFDDLRYGREMAIVKDGKRVAVADVPSQMNTLRFTPDGQMAVAYFSYNSNDELVLNGVMDPTVVSFVDLSNGETHSVSVGYSPREIIFSEEGARALVLSRSEVVVIDMENFSVDISYPLTLDKDEEIDPSGAVLSPDGRYALIAIAGSSDLFQLDLEVVSVDLEALDGTPATLAADIQTQTTVVTYGSRSYVDVITQHGFIERSEVQLDEPAPDIIMGDGFAVLYNDTGTGSDIYRLDLESMEVVEFVAANPVDSLQLTPSQSHVVAILRPEDHTGGGLDGYQDARWGLAIANLDGDEIASLVLESQPVGMELVEDGDSAYALLLLDGFESLIQVDLNNPGAVKQIELSSSPAGINANPNGRFSISHTDAFGLLSFLNPETGKMKTASGFASIHLLTNHPLPRRSSGKE